MCETLNQIKAKLKICLRIINKYDWLLSAYVTDFYIADHWYKLKTGWRNHLTNVPIERLSALLESDTTKTSVHNYVWPLELLALKTILRQLCISRERHLKSQLPVSMLLEHPKLKHIFEKCVKPKKRHEIITMAAICARSCYDRKVDFVLDFGAGLGHLARILGYGYGVQVCCLEMQYELNQQAEIIDKKLEAIAIKQLPIAERAHFKRPAHLTMRLVNTILVDDLIDAIKKALQITGTNFTFGIIGLHPCGDLCSVLINIFLECKQAKFLNFVSCCYHKLSTPMQMPTGYGYPLSTYLQKYGNAGLLSYEAREISCHAIEMYSERLSNGAYEHLKIHSYRAAAERIIVKHFPLMNRSGLRSVKHTSHSNFIDYFYKAVKGTPMAHLDVMHLETLTTLDDLKHWQRIVIFYTLRLMLAPLVESVVLYDRALYLMENNCDVNIEAIFDPRLSPRNHITYAIKS